MKSLLFLIIVLFTNEAYVSSTLDYITLEEMVAKSHLIVIATRSNDKKNPNVYVINEVLKDTEKKFSKNKSVTLAGANDELNKQIDEAQKKGQPYPFPIITAYKSTINMQDFNNKPGPYILFAQSAVANKYYFTNEQSFEDVKKKKDIIQLIGLTK